MANPVHLLVGSSMPFPIYCVLREREGGAFAREKSPPRLSSSSHFRSSSFPFLCTHTHSQYVRRASAAIFFAMEEEERGGEK